MVFTDIKNSTLLWETYPTAMRSGIKVHNNIMRRQLRIVGGYEFKTEGDAFLVCFPTASSALLWCFSVQAILLDAPWPTEILDSIHGKEAHDSEGNLIYRGLSVRMGIHWGAPVCETDPITRRMDYFGPVVNRAARISAEADGGQITVSSDFLAEINRCVKASQDFDSHMLSADDIFGDEEIARAISRELRTLSSQGFEVKALGSRKLKGLENPEFIYLMYPQSLAGRLSTAVSPPKPNMARSHIDPEEVWHLWEISLRLEVLCTSLNTGRAATATQARDLIGKLRGRGGELTEDALAPFLEHIITRIEVRINLVYRSYYEHLVIDTLIQNAMANIFIRRLLTSGQLGSNIPATTSIIDIFAALESRLGLGTNGVGNTSDSSSNRITEIPYTSPDYDYSAPPSPHS